MCLLVPGKVVSVKEREVVVDFGIKRSIARSFEEVSVGEFVLVSNGVVCEKVSKEEVLNFLEALR